MAAIYKIAIIEDLPAETGSLRALLHQYTEETGTKFYITCYSNGPDFLENYDGSFDLVLMDIQMAPLDGMQTARRLRTIDEKVILIFVTSMAQYALQGYQVEALDFLVKPIKYPVIRRMLNRALPRIQSSVPEKLSLKTGEGTLVLAPSDICYVESYSHKVIVHTLERSIHGSDTMQSVAAKLPEKQFFRCHVAFLINLDHIERVQGNDVWVTGVPIPISKYRRKSFLDALAAYLGDKI